VVDFGRPVAFVPQKVKAKRRAIALATMVTLAVAAAILYIIAVFLA
jgi:hypothetical protein